MLVVDTSGLLAALFPDRHKEWARILTEIEGRSSFLCLCWRNSTI